MDEEKIDIKWDEFIDVLTEETMEGCDGASDEFMLGIIENKIKETFPDVKNLSTSHNTD